MNLTTMGQVQVSVKELMNLRLKHWFSAADIEPTGALTEQFCGSITTVSGYTEWLGDADLPISIGWDWSIGIQLFSMTCEPPAQVASWLRDDFPRTNIQLLDEYGIALAWQDNLHVLATWVDAHAWQSDVAKAVAAV